MTFNTSVISAFMAVGKRYTLDIKLHRMGSAVVVIQIDERSQELFVARWVSAVADIRSSVYAFFGMDQDEDFGHLKGVSLIESAHDRMAWHTLHYAMNVHSHEYDCETFAAIASFVAMASVEVVREIR